MSAESFEDFFIIIENVYEFLEILLDPDPGTEPVNSIADPGYTFKPEALPPVRFPSRRHTERTWEYPSSPPPSSQTQIKVGSKKENTRNQENYKLIYITTRYPYKYCPLGFYLKDFLAFQNTIPHVQTRVAPDTELAGYRISGRISGLI